MATSGAAAGPRSRLRRHLNVAVVGGGPSGLVTLKTLLELGQRYPDDVAVNVSLFEAEDAVGGTFRYRAYDNAQLVSSKQLTAFSDYRLPLDAPDHLSLQAYVQYLEGYVQHFDLAKRAKRFCLGTRVERICREGNGGHAVSWRDAHGVVETETFTHVSLCSGLHVLPAWPDIMGLQSPAHFGSRAKSSKASVHGENGVANGLDSARATREASLPFESSSESDACPSPMHLSTFQRRILTLHSSSYKSPDIYRGKRVMILGTGETGMDMAYEAVKARAKEIVLCTREGFLSFPAVLENFMVLGVTFDRPTPIDGLITNLFETAYVHPWVARSHLRWFVSDAIIKKVLWVLTGTEAGCNQWVGELPPHRLGRAFTFLNKSAKAMPYINRPWKQRHWVLETIARYLDPPSVRPDEPHIDLAPFPSHVLPSGQVIFKRNKRKESDYWASHAPFSPDVVVFATGYKQAFPFVDNSNGSYPNPSDADCRDIFALDDPTVSFIGFTRPGVGAIPPQAELSAQLWALVIAGKLAPPQDQGHYYLLARPEARIRYGVDYSSYVSQLARDMGAAPSLGQLWREYGLRVLLVYCFSAYVLPSHEVLVAH